MIAAIRNKLNCHEKSQHYDRDLAKNFLLNHGQISASSVCMTIPGVAPCGTMITGMSAPAALYSSHQPPEHSKDAAKFERSERSFEIMRLAEWLFALKCEGCGREKILPYSCKGRAVCSSCCGRRMADTAAHLVDRVFPRVPVRQWVLSLPHALRYRLAYDSRTLTAVLNVFVRAVFGFLRQRARNCGIEPTQCGAVTFIQRFGDSLNCNPHFHLIATMS